jgi:hypothetical protein
MTLSAASALPLQLEKTDKKKREAKMPLSKYFKRSRRASNVRDEGRYGDGQREASFYATANSRPGMKPADESKSKPKRRMTLGQRIAAKD